VTAATPFVAQLRARPEAIRLGTAGDPVITVRVQVPEVWDTVRIDAPPDTSVLVLKLRGFEVLDEAASLSAAGAVNGSTFLVTFRRRRPVR